MLIQDMIQERRSQLPFKWCASPLQAFGHTAMLLVDAVARDADGPVLYFHGKGVSYAPQARNAEVFRRHINRLIAEADRWSGFMADSDVDACGSLLCTDARSNMQFFAGNFWMARASYLRSLPPYQQFYAQPVAGRQPGERHLPELAVNRSGKMRAHAIDGTCLRTESFNAYMVQLLGREEPLGEGISGYARTVVIAGDAPRPDSPHWAPGSG